MLAIHAPDEGMSISVTERQDFQRCQRMWQFGSPNMLALEPKQVAPALYVGAGVHFGLAAQPAGYDPIEMARLWCDEQERKYAEAYKEWTGVSPSNEEWVEFQESRLLVIKLLTHYFEHYGPDPVKPYTFEAAEITFKCPIPGTNGFLVGTIDGILSRGQELWLKENKTYSQKPNEEDLQDDDQQLGYMWAARQLFGVTCVGILYDGLMKRVPQPPRVLKDGSVSVAVDQYTTPKLYRDTLAEQGLKPTDKPKGSTTFDTYQEFIDLLEQRMKQPVNNFFARFRFRRSAAEIDSFGEQLPILYDRMLYAKQNPETIIPNFRWEGCWDCNYRDLCRLTQRKEDVEYTMEQYYRSSPGYTTRWALEGDRLTLNGLDDLRTFYNNIKDEPYRALLGEGKEQTT